MRRVQKTISAGALLAAAAHLRWPELTIDAITVALIVVAVVPWLGSVFRTIELPGGLKVEYPDLKATQENAARAGLLSPKIARGGGPDYAFQLISGEDPNLALAGLRIEIEKRLNRIAEANGIQSRGGVGRLLTLLDSMDLLSSDEATVLRDMIGLLNSAVHGAEVDPRAVDWALEIGPRLLGFLDERAG